MQPLTTRHDMDGGIWGLWVEDADTHWRTWIDREDPDDGTRRTMAEAYAPNRAEAHAAARALLADPNIIPPGAVRPPHDLPPPCALVEELFA